LAFFLRSAQRFFMISDNRLRPAGVMLPRLFMARAAVLEAGALSLTGAFAKSKPSNTPIARASRSLSVFSSVTIVFRFKLVSCHKSVWVSLSAQPTLLFENGNRIGKASPAHYLQTERGQLVTGPTSCMNSDYERLLSATPWNAFRGWRTSTDTNTRERTRRLPCDRQMK
jgi:hypothetical protein